jgi:hypothetical protein
MTRVGPAGAPSRIADGNTEKACTNDRHSVNARPGSSSGNKMVQNRRRGPAPRVAAAFSSPRSIPLT